MSKTDLKILLDPLRSKQSQWQTRSTLSVPVKICFWTSCHFEYFCLGPHQKVWLKRNIIFIILHERIYFLSKMPYNVDFQNGNRVKSWSLPECYSDSNIPLTLVQVKKYTLQIAFAVHFHIVFKTYLGRILIAVDVNVLSVTWFLDSQPHTKTFGYSNKFPIYTVDVILFYRVVKQNVNV